MNKSDTLRMVYGFCLLGVIAALAISFGLGKVEEKTSFGLHEIMTMLAMMVGGWIQWAFGGSKRDDKE